MRCGNPKSQQQMTSNKSNKKSGNIQKGIFIRGQEWKLARCSCCCYCCYWCCWCSLSVHKTAKQYMSPLRRLYFHHWAEHGNEWGVSFVDSNATIYLLLHICPVHRSPLSLPHYLSLSPCHPFLPFHNIQQFGQAINIIINARLHFSLFLVIAFVTQIMHKKK